MSKAIINVSTFDLDHYHSQQYVLFEREIIARGPMEQFGGADQVYDLTGQTILPGMVLGHGHIYSSFARGWNSPFAPNSFRQLLEQLWWKLDAGLDRDMVRSSALVAGMECIRNGITTLIDHHASGRIIGGSLETIRQALGDELGLRGIYCFETSDRFPIEQCIDENLEFASACAANDHSTMAAGMFGLHASMTLSSQTLSIVARRRQQLPIHIHVAESVEDQQDCQDRYGLSVIQRLDAAGLLDQDSLLGHCIHIDAAERVIMAQRGVTVALNPASNMNNAVGLPDYIALREAGIPVVIGNDGLGFNLGRDIQSFLVAFRHQAGNPLSVGLDDVRLAMRQAWDFAGKRLGCRLGRIDAGYQADFFSLPYDPPTPLDQDNALGHWFYGMLDSLRPSNVWCSGQRILYQNQLQVDESAIRRQARQQSAALWRTLKN